MKGLVRMLVVAFALGWLMCKYFPITERHSISPEEQSLIEMHRQNVRI